LSLDKSKPLKKESYIKQFENEVTTVVNDEVKYIRKSTFFLSPLPAFDNLPTFAIIEDIRSIPIGETKEIILKSRIASLKNPWREKLGYKLAYLYNRVATDNPPAKEEIHSWWKDVYERNYKEVIEILSK
jgi:hypothetical protein